MSLWPSDSKRKYKTLWQGRMHWVGGKPAAGQRRHQGEDSGFENALQAGKINPASMQAVPCLEIWIHTTPLLPRKAHDEKYFFLPKKSTFFCQKKVLLFAKKSTFFCKKKYLFLVIKTHFMPSNALLWEPQSHHQGRLSGLLSSPIKQMTPQTTRVPSPPSQWKKSTLPLLHLQKKVHWLIWIS